MSQVEALEGIWNDFCIVSKQAGIDKLTFERIRKSRSFERRVAMTVQLADKWPGGGKRKTCIHHNGLDFCDVFNGRRRIVYTRNGARYSHKPRSVLVYDVVFTVYR